MTDSNQSSRNPQQIKIAVTVVLLAVVASILYWVLDNRASASFAFDEGQGRVTKNASTDTMYPVHTTLSESRYDAAAPALWSSNCVLGGCVRFDGYSNFLELPADIFPAASQGFSIRVWVAPRFDLASTAGEFVSVISHFDSAGENGINFGFDADSGWGLQIRVGENLAEVLSGNDNPIGDGWVHLAAVYDNEKGEVSLYQNGSLVTSAQMEVSSWPTRPSSQGFVGRNAKLDNLDGLFAVGSYAGRLDNLEIYQRALSPDRIESLYEQDKAAAGASLTQASAQASAQDWLPPTSERHRPQYHALATAGWTGRPLAPLYYDGRYHLFFLTNPKGPWPGQNHWGHWVSDDMLNWQELPIAMSADSKTPQGLGAGSAMLDATGKPVIFFSVAQKVNPAQRVNPNAFGQIALARPNDTSDKNLERWAIQTSTVISQKPGEGTAGQFRDPFVYKDKDSNHWYALIAGQSTTRNGVVMIYDSTDLQNWQYQGELFGLDRQKFAQIGPQWSSPVFLPLGKDKQGRNKHILIVQTGGRSHSNNSYYWIGRWDQKKFRFIPDDIEAKRLDTSRLSLVAPTGFVDPKSSRSILFYHASGEDTPQQRYLAGWANSLGLPMQLSLAEDGGLKIAPIDEVANLRGKVLVDMKDVSFQEVRRELRKVEADVFEIDMTMDMDSTSGLRTGLIFHRDPGNTERTIVSWDKPRSLLVLQRNHSSMDIDVLARSNIGNRIDAIGKNLRVQFFVDRSQIEAFFDQRHLLFGRAYPAGDATNMVALLGPNAIKVKSFQMWRMNSLSDRFERQQDPIIAAEPWVWTSQIENHDFSSCKLDGWQLGSGNAFVAEAVTNRSHYENQLDSAFNPARRIPGICHFWGLLAPDADAATGEMYSQPFEVSSADMQLNFLIGGGRDIENLYVALVDAQNPKLELLRTTGGGHERYRRVYWGLKPYVGQTVQLKIVDNATGRMGHLNLDSFNLSAPKADPKASQKAPPTP